MKKILLFLWMLAYPLGAFSAPTQISKIPFKYKVAGLCAGALLVRPVVRKTVKFGTWIYDYFYGRKKAALPLQCGVRSCLEKASVSRDIYCVTAVQSGIRVIKSKENTQVLLENWKKRCTPSAILIQNSFRGFFAKKHVKKLKEENLVALVKSCMRRNLAYEKTQEIINSFKDKKCVICLDDLIKGLPMSKLSCGHEFCKKCLVKHLDIADRQTCPMCRRFVVDKDFKKIGAKKRDPKLTQEEYEALKKCLRSAFDLFRKSFSEKLSDAYLGMTQSNTTFNHRFQDNFHGLKRKLFMDKPDEIFYSKLNPLKFKIIGLVQNLNIDEGVIGIYEPRFKEAIDKCIEGLRENVWESSEGIEFVAKYESMRPVKTSYYKETIDHFGFSDKVFSHSRVTGEREYKEYINSWDRTYILLQKKFLDYVVQVFINLEKEIMLAHRGVERLTLNAGLLMDFLNRGFPLRFRQ